MAIQKIEVELERPDAIRSFPKDNRLPIPPKLIQLAWRGQKPRVAIHRVGDVLILRPLQELDSNEDRP